MEFIKFKTKISFNFWLLKTNLLINNNLSNNKYFPYYFQRITYLHIENWNGTINSNDGKSFPNNKKLFWSSELENLWRVPPHQLNNFFFHGATNLIKFFDLQFEFFFQCYEWTERALSIKKWWNIPPTLQLNEYLFQLFSSLSTY